MTKNSVIDIHAHYYPQAYLNAFADADGSFGAYYREEPKGPVIDVGPLHAGPLERKFIDLDLRLEAMDIQGVEVQALSLTQPMVYWAGDQLSVKLSAIFNDALAQAHEHYPNRLFGLAMLPMQVPELAVMELERAATLPGIKGVYMATAILDRELSDPIFFPVYERIADLGLAIFLHPLKVIGMENRLAKYFLANLLGNPFDTTIAAAQLVFGGVLDRFPNLTFVLPHAGGALPYLAGRLHHGWKVRPECRHLEKGPQDYLRHFYYDTISHSPESLSFLVDRVGADRVLLGSDYCFDMGVDRPMHMIRSQEGLAQIDQDRICGENARALLRL